MVIKRYVVKDMPEAVVMIRKELGKDAVILSTKRIRMKKWFGLWRQSRIEVLAAIGDDVPVRSFDAPFLKAAHSTVATRDSKFPGQGQGDETQPTVSAAFKTDVLTSQDADAGAGSELQKVREDIAGLKRLVESTLQVREPQVGVWDVTISRLAKQGVSEQLLWDLIADVSMSGLPSRLGQSLVGNTSNQDMTSESEVLLRSRLRDELAKLTSVQPIAPTARVVMFVGPTGVGKTTTIAKIAALQVLSGKRKVGLITTDTFRIAAVEQLRTYANILNVPLEVVSKMEEMPLALEHLRNCDLIFIDTAGRNFEMEEHLARIQSVLAVAPVDEVYLVLSLTAKVEDMTRVVELFSEIPIDKFLFTKLDETHSYGAMLNLLLTYQKPLSYLTTGQNVPNDIEIASLDKVVNLVFSGVAV